MNQNLFILDNTYKSLLKNDYKDLISLVKNKLDIIVGNYIFTIFNKDLILDTNDYEIFSMNLENLDKKKYNDKDNLLKILNLTENNICYYDEKIYIKEEFKNILDSIIKNTFSDEYIKFLLKSYQKIHLDIYDYIKKLDIVNFNKVYTDQFSLIKHINNKPFYPINYCYNFLNEYQNKIAKEVIMNMFNLLKHFDYDIHPKILDIDNYEIYEDINISKYNEITNLHDLIINCLNKSDFSLFTRCINIFKLNYKNSDFIFILKNKEKENNNLDNILKVIKESNIYENKDFLELLLILNKVNLFNLENINNIIINYNELIYYLNKYNSDISFYYILDKFFKKININIILSQDFTKIYLYFISKNDKINNKINNKMNNYICEYFKFILKNIQYTHESNIFKILIDSFDKEKLKLNDIEELIELIIISKHKYLIKDIFKINDKIKYIIQKSDILFRLLNNKDEELFYFIKNLFDAIEFTKIINELKDQNGNSIYHYICKNNICLGYNINNKIRNNDGFKPLDLCQISNKYYKI